MQCFSHWGTLPVLGIICCDLNSGRDMAALLCRRKEKSAITCLLYTVSCGEAMLGNQVESDVH